MVPPTLDAGAEQAVADARRILDAARKVGLAGRIGHLLIPGMITEDGGRPADLRPRMEPVDCWRAVRSQVGPVRALATQVTAFHDKAQLGDRLRALTAAGVDGVVFVGVPRNMREGAAPGMAPTDALAQFRDIVANRGSILIPTRPGELERFAGKCERGATFGVTQLLYSDAVVGFLRDFAARVPYRPSLLLSFGFVPSLEARTGLIDWLIKDPGNPVVAGEQRFVADTARRPLRERQRRLLDLYRRVVDGVQGLGFELGIHLEAPYGYSEAAFETFAQLLDHWAPGP